jgi:hypothetical protein
MKKLFVLFLLGVFAVIGFATTAYADDDLVNLYPYNQVGCTLPVGTCTNIRVLSSNWKVEYDGHRYHAVGGSTRYAKDFVDTNADGFISALEMGALSYNAFGSLIINDTDDEVILSTTNVRTDLTSVVHRIYSYFDEDNNLILLENHIFTYHLVNEGTNEAPNFRLATEAEKAAYDAAPAESKPANMLVSYIRMMMDSANPKGYVLEPIHYLTWVKLVYDPIALTWGPITKTPGTESTWSNIIAGNPDFVYIPAGWTVLSFGTLERDNSNALTTAFVRNLPFSMLKTNIAPANIYYVDQPATFAGITALDDDAVTAGVQIIVDYQGTFDLPNTVTASWRKMFGTNGKIVNVVEPINYRVEISQEETLLQTINFTYDTDTSSYVASGPVTVVDSSVFGVGYTATWITETPKGDVTQVVADIAVGVLPPRFVGITNRYVDEGIVVDLLEGITANDGYGNDKTNSIVLTAPAGFNRFNPKPGTYTINLEFTHNIFIAGVPAIVNVEGTNVPYNMDLHYNKPVAVNADNGVTKVWSDVSIFRTVGSAFGSVMVVVAADGTMKESYDRYTWTYTTSSSSTIFDATHFANWQANLTLLPGEFVVAAHGSVHATRLRPTNLAFGDQISVQVGTQDFDYDIVTQRSYTLVVDDITAPTLLVVKPKVVVTAGEFTNVNEVVLGNVVALDNYDTAAQLALYVSSSGGLNLNNPGTYNVQVTAEDRAGNASVVSFQVEVKAPVITNDSILDMIENNTLTEADIQAIIDAGLITPAQIQLLIDASIDALPPDEVGTSLVVTIIVALSSGLMSFGGAFILMKKKLF